MMHIWTKTSFCASYFMCNEALQECNVKPRSQLLTRNLNLRQCNLYVFFADGDNLGTIATAVQSSQIVGHKRTCMFCDLCTKCSLPMHTHISRLGVLFNWPLCGCWDCLAYVSCLSNGRWKLDIFSHACDRGSQNFSLYLHANLGNFFSTPASLQLIVPSTSYTIHQCSAAAFHNSSWSGASNCNYWWCCHLCYNFLFNGWFVS